MSANTQTQPRRANRGVVARKSGGMRLDRLARAGICVGIVLLAIFYIKPAVGLVGAWFARADGHTELVKLQQENRALKAQRAALLGESGVAQQARKLGMVLPGEVPYVVTGLPGDHN